MGPYRRSAADQGFLAEQIRCPAALLLSLDFLVQASSPPLCCVPLGLGVTFIVDHVLLVQRVLDADKMGRDPRFKGITYFIRCCTMFAEWPCLCV